HAGIAINRIDAREAQRIFDTLAEWGEDKGWHETLPDAGEDES
ncbi:MAG TPA: HypC/HybG/HupF family hydrogenase formation chaperone, partial [Gimesia maris]|nr:HypC/HybG/HupF family hydrogenase formation chaperone [Gimesia maris]